MRVHGDSGYTQNNFVLTPVGNPDAVHRYNMHILLRGILLKDFL